MVSLRMTGSSWFSPVYSYCIPPYIVRFIKKLQLDSPYVFAVISYGMYGGGTARFIRPGRLSDIFIMTRPT